MNSAAYLYPWQIDLVLMLNYDEAMKPSILQSVWKIVMVNQREKKYLVLLFYPGTLVSLCGCREMERQ